MSCPDQTRVVAVGNRPSRCDPIVQTESQANDDAGGEPRSDWPTPSPRRDAGHPDKDHGRFAYEYGSTSQNPSHHPPATPGRQQTASDYRDAPKLDQHPLHNGRAGDCHQEQTDCETGYRPTGQMGYENGGQNADDQQ